MAQIVSFAVNERGNYVLEIKRAKQPLPRQRTTQVAGTTVDEQLHGLFGKDPDGNDVPLMASISVRYSNQYRPQLTRVKPVKAEKENPPSNLLPFDIFKPEEPERKNGTSRFTKAKSFGG
jgi:hypothetical protein